MGKIIYCNTEGDHGNTQGDRQGVYYPTGQKAQPVYSPREDSINARIARGETVAVGNALYSQCSKCGQMVKLNKFLFGDLHFCG